METSAPAQTHPLLVIVLALLRHGLMGIGGSWVGAGYLTNDQLGQVVGAVLCVVSVAWSILQKRNQRFVVVHQQRIIAAQSVALDKLNA